MASASVVLPEDNTREQAGAVEEFLDRGRAQGTFTAKLVSPHGDSVTVPAELFTVLSQIAGILARGDGVSVSPVASELTTTEAARMLGMSRPTLIHLLDTDQLRSRRVGTHRRVLLEDALSYKRESIRRRLAEFDALRLEADALGLDDDD